MFVAVMCMLLTVSWDTATAANQADCLTPVAAKGQQFSGTTATVTDPLSIESGVYTLSGSHKGSGNFVVWIYTETGDKDLLFNEIGVYSGETVFRIESPTRVIFDIEGNGPWEIEITSAF
jgi:hypothetical protein